MPWARLDDGFHDHPKVDGLSLAAVGLYTLCLTWSHRHRKTALVPGHITEARVRKLAGKQATSLVDELLSSGLWEHETGLGGWVIHDFADYLPKERNPDERREAGRRGAAKRWEGHSKPDGKLPSDSMASDSSRATAPAYPTRTRPEDEEQTGGDRPVTLPAPAATGSPRRSRCTRHPNGDPGDVDCGGCARDREHDEREAARAEQAAKDAARRVVESCPDCHGGIWLDDGSKCSHRNARKTA